jgi:iron(III) transport system ATP-binding protein
MPEIEVAGLVRTFADIRALDDVSFKVADGELFTLLGPSGCGKSTTLMSIAGFQTPNEGRIAVGGEPIFDASSRLNLAAERRNLGIVFQSYAVWPHMTVFDNLAFPLRVRKMSRKDIGARVREVLELVDLGPLEKRYPHQLSGGQQQRVALGRALVYSPSVLLLDEPFSNLDAKLRERARTWVKDLQHSLGLTTIFVTHDQDEALSMSDRVCVMNFGVVQQIGTPEEVYRKPANRFVAEFVGQVNLIAGTVAGYENNVATVDVGESARALRVRVDQAPEPRSSVTVAVRPEALVVEVASSAMHNGSNTLSARVTSVAFLGDHYQYELDASGLALTAQSSHLVGSADVNVHIPPDACAVVE